MRFMAIQFCYPSDCRDITGLHKYKDGPNTPFYPFGYGLSYTSFEYSQPQLSSARIKPTESVNVTFTVKNTGTREGVEVAQLYIRNMYSSATRPVKELKDFCRVALAPGEYKRVTFTVTPDKLACFDGDMKYVVESGEFEVMVGGSSKDEDLQRIRFNVQ